MLFRSVFISNKFQSKADAQEHSQLATTDNNVFSYQPQPNELSQ